MFNKITSKIKNIILPCLSLGAATAFFFSISFFFGVGQKSDFILLTITVLSTFGTILQISWYGLLPRLTSSKSVRYSSYVISNGFMYCLLANLIPFSLVPILEIKYIFFSGCIYSLFFQLHQLSKNIFVYLGELKAFYIFDAAGYLFNILCMLSFERKKIESLSIDEVFFILSCGWFLIFIAELYFLRLYLSHKLSVKPLVVCIIPTWKTRVANSGFILKELLTSYALNSLSPSGGLTIYSYVNKIATAIFQLFSQYKVNSWVGEVKSQGVRNVRLKDMNRVSLLSSLDYLLFLFFSYILIITFIHFVGVRVDTKWVMVCAVFSGMLYLIQSIEQPFSRFVYMSRCFSDITFSDGSNFIFYMLFFVFGYSLSNIYIILLGIVLAQLLSLHLYIKYSKRIISK